MQAMIHSIPSLRQDKQHITNNKPLDWCDMHIYMHATYEMWMWTTKRMQSHVENKDNATLTEVVLFSRNFYLILSSSRTIICFWAKSVRVLQDPSFLKSPPTTVFNWGSSKPAAAEGVWVVTSWLFQLLFRNTPPPPPNRKQEESPTRRTSTQRRQLHCKEHSGNHVSPSDPQH